MRKTCFKCARTLPVALFYRHTRMADGHLGKCKDCTKSDVKTNRKKRALQYSDYERSRYGTNVRAEYRRRKQFLKRKTGDQKTKARLALKRAIKRGDIVRPLFCQLCLSGGSMQGHHHDYHAALDVIWLCSSCHLGVHGKTLVRKLNA